MKKFILKAFKYWVLPILICLSITCAVVYYLDNNPEFGHVLVTTVYLCCLYVLMLRIFSLEDEQDHFHKLIHLYDLHKDFSILALEMFKDEKDGLVKQIEVLEVELAVEKDGNKRKAIKRTKKNEDSPSA
jgi:Ca2+/Na+ antiporter